MSALANAQQLKAALHALYHNEDSSVKEQAGKWLEAWQGTVDAWSVSDAVLHDPGSNMEAQYFCAQTLRTKVDTTILHTRVFFENQQFVGSTSTWARKHVSGNPMSFHEKLA